VPQWSTHVGNNTVLEDDVVFLHKQEELAVARGLGRKPVAQVSTNILNFRRCTSLLSDLLTCQCCCTPLLVDLTMHVAGIWNHWLDRVLSLLYSFWSNMLLWLKLLCRKKRRWIVSQQEVLDRTYTT
jgi:hypothetical protein